MHYKKLKILSEKELVLIDKTTMEILEKEGFCVPHEEMLSIAKSKGASVDFKNKIIRVKEEIVRDCIKIAGKKFILYGSDKKKTARFGYNEPNFMTSASQYIWLDLINFKRFKPTLEDIKKAIVIANSLENINIVGQMGVPSDYDVRIKDLICFFEQIKYTNKPLSIFFNNGENAKIINDICEILRGGNKELVKFPLMEAFLEPISPLKYLKEGIEIMMEFVRRGLPLGIGPMAMCGMSAPCTIAGTLVIENADILSGVVLSQFINPGIPINYWGDAHNIDYSTAYISFGSPEQALMGIAFNQLGDYYGFPVSTNTGLSDALAPDSQSGVERGITQIMAALSGSSLFGHMGICGADQGFSIHEMIIEEEMVSYIKRILKGFKISKETIAMEVIRRNVRKGNFLLDDHTMQNFKSESWFPTIYNRLSYDSWNKDRESLIEKADIKSKELLKSERKYIENDLEDEISLIVNNYISKILNRQ
ncbi:MAG: trimethylamine methyltransferase family protein [Actinobacteria bacterium]|nr:trimethylamine methyltransferase family protein [Actinomycetota bacterium]